MKRREQDRQRSHTVCFWASPEERQQIEARIMVSGMPKGQYYIKSLLHQEINIVVGKYQSDRLSLEIRRLRERLEEVEEPFRRGHRRLNGLQGTLSTASGCGEQK